MEQEQNIIGILIQDLKLAHQKTIEVYDKAYEDMKTVATKFHELAVLNLHPNQYNTDPNPQEPPDEVDPSLTGGM